ncbi:transporter substrate-binding domain-containing protein [Sporolactobacillus shoreicorticis]|uniref:Transporter substrate-binding domain-containing protein n=1 Tax=Sporolactobacillus shoreicorticis TaxID=1923877 RepID=A0ABW5S1C8_9BACL|nr:transporter substrate-binding domain-containing protein [Sporolactobacillus shoreicorticis]MCO7126532.1 transporter substrate-binding domain-containing protein [Sporolactobacillus shoreicorticis]
MKKLIALLLISVLILALTGCSGKSSGSGKRNVKTVQIAVPTAEKPLSYTDENGKLTGYEVEILKAVDKKIKGYTFNIQSVSSNAQQVGLDTGKYDLIAEGFFKNPVREKKYLIPDENDGASLIRIYSNKKNKNLNSVEDLRGLNLVPTDANGGMYYILTLFNKSYPENKLKIKTTDSGLSTADKLKSVDSGKYDALILPSNLGQADVIKKEKLNITTSEPVLVIPTYFLLSKKNTKLKKEIDNALKELKEDGTLSKLSVKYYGEDNLKYKITDLDY